MNPPPSSSSSLSPSAAAAAAASMLLLSPTTTSTTTTTTSSSSSTSPPSAAATEQVTSFLRFLRHQRHQSQRELTLALADATRGHRLPPPILLLLHLVLLLLRNNRLHLGRSLGANGIAARGRERGARRGAGDARAHGGGGRRAVCGRGGAAGVRGEGKVCRDGERGAARGRAETGGRGGGGERRGRWWQRSKPIGALPSLGGSATMGTTAAALGGGTLPQKDPYTLELEVRVQELQRERDRLAEKTLRMEAELKARIDRSGPVQNFLKMMERKDALLRDYRARLGQFDKSVLDEPASEAA
ncbi:hypothetical protein DFJ73DRAFT_63365 [Zopfochytrium polystomum]|nr:hypothetical protein DFJ73DRAFT_63365 [Zopfochytrium polystomum]